MEKSLRYLIYAFLLCASGLLSACLARPERHNTSYPNRPSTSAIPSDASRADKEVALTGNLLVDYANKMGVSPVVLHNPQLYTFIHRWMGVPHRMGGMKRSGVDCSGFVLMLYSSVYQTDLPRTSYQMADAVKKRRISRLKEGDLVFFSFGGSRVSHVGIYLHNDYFVHVSTSKGVILSKLTDPWYEKYYVKGGTLF